MNQKNDAYGSSDDLRHEIDGWSLEYDQSYDRDEAMMAYAQMISRDVVAGAARARRALAALSPAQLLADARATAPGLLHRAAWR